MSPRNTAASVNARLKNLAQREGVEVDYMNLKYAMERFLWRLSLSSYSQRFVLKGAALFSVWRGPMFRMTRDTDLACAASLSDDFFEQCFRELCELPVPEDDGVMFHADTVQIEDIREGARYHGKRIFLSAHIAQARVRLQFDIGFGDAIVPGPEQRDFPVLLEDMPAPRLSMYPRYTVVAEKFGAMIAHGMLNSRLKDYADLWILAQAFDFDYATLEEAIEHTFRRQGLTLPSKLPIGLSATFATNPEKRTLWRVFQKRVKSRQGDPVLPESLEKVIEDIVSFLLPIWEPQTPLPVQWIATQGWQ